MLGIIRRCLSRQQTEPEPRNAELEEPQSKEYNALRQVDETSYICNHVIDIDVLFLLLYEPDDERQPGHWVVEETSCNEAFSSDVATSSGQAATTYDVTTPSGATSSSDLDANQVFQQTLEPWSIERRCLDAHALYLLYNEPFSLHQDTVDTLLKEPSFTGRAPDTKGASRLLSTRDYNQPFNPASPQPEEAWIEDLWQCSTTDALLAEAERIWLDGDSQWAHEIADEISEDPSLSRKDFVRFFTST
ncbi:hypothetical protein PENANT_c001G01269 [Penicillium antarcticum]|uniref:Uncharacterized protein n=1 Tax=Penicillium antarcticum TaxID=416450 RepID=A0A1V6QP81_9EURO|nr:uncharacterized protein N7508_010324 [Penicillium antarcticum]KAJ5295503.1 hypothetical protein N7508_010324 [Penicillium antarcticum]OQD91005.1 hypothetical protein PENANT_c001G01269 [Penicillium antarcticum]